MGTRNFWDEELTAEEIQSLCQRIAHEITKRQLEAPAIILLECHKPIANFNAHMALAASGFFAPLLGYELFNDLTRLLAKRDNIERLLVEIEDQASNRGKTPVLTEEKA